MPPTTLHFDAAFLFWPGGLLILALVGWQAIHLRRAGLRPWENALLLTLRTAGLLALLFLAARPVRVREFNVNSHPYISVLVDRSRSMSLTDEGDSRYQRALNLLGGKLAPLLQKQGWKIRPLVFAEDAVRVNADQLATTAPTGARSDLGGALLAAMREEAAAPAAVVVLSDGVANETRSNTRALTDLVAAGTPVVAFGVGADRSAASFAVLDATAPAIVPPKQEFRVSVQLEVNEASNLPGFDLLLLRDDLLVQTKRLDNLNGSRLWNETFRVTEPEPGAHEYTVQAAVPDTAGLIVNNRSASTRVQITTEQEMRVLFVQGTLTWDYKFIGKALRADPSVHITGLSRTSDKSVYRQNVETEGELLGGFPATLEQAAPFRVVVISNLKASDLTAAQQEILARFVGELGGGLLLVGGPGTFDASWKDSALEKLLPVTFDPSPGLDTLSKSFGFRLTAAALRHPAFQIADANLNAAAWGKLPPFLQYGRVANAKPGAVVWAEHDSDTGPDGRKRILMATQRYGAGTSVVLCVENFWRWRLAKEAEPLQFDRFWRQLFRYLGENSRETILIDFNEQALALPAEIRATVERQARASDYVAVAEGKPQEKKESYRVEVRGPQPDPIYQADLPLEVGAPLPISFRAAKPGTYRVAVLDSHNNVAAERSLDLRDDAVEMTRTARDLENLKQWAALTGGVALPAENPGNLDDVVKLIRTHLDTITRTGQSRLPAGLNGWVLAAVLALLGAEWCLRKRWNLN